jgi:hypothetical protein
MLAASQVTEADEPKSIASNAAEPELCEGGD